MRKTIRIRFSPGARETLFACFSRESMQELQEEESNGFSVVGGEDAIEIVLEKPSDIVPGMIDSEGLLTPAALRMCERRTGRTETG